MKNSQAKIDTLLDMLVTKLHDRLVEQENAPSPEQLRHIEQLIELSQANSGRKAKVATPPGPQSKVGDISDEDLVAALKSKRPEDLFPRRGPRNGKREPVAPPPPAPRTCDIHTAVPCVENPDQTSPVMWVCPECAKVPEKKPETFVSLKALI